MVIAIIGVLATIGGIGTNTAMEKMKKNQAQKDLIDLQNAVRLYYNSYKKYPVAGSGADVTVETDAAFMNPLLGADDEALNPKGTVFFSGQAAKDRGGSPAGGVAFEANGGGALYDPWGNLYSVTIDTDRNNRITKPGWDAEATVPIVANQPAIAWSPGEDKEVDETQDNVKSWK